MEAILWDIAILSESAKLIGPPKSTKDEIRRKRMRWEQEEYLEGKKKRREGREIEYA